MDEHNLTDDEREQYQDEWDDLTTQELLQGIFIELTQIRALLSQSETGQESGPSMYECDLCGATVAGDERERHAVGEHKAPAGIAGQFFEEV